MRMKHAAQNDNINPMEVQRKESISERLDVGRIVRHVKPLRPEDTLSRAVELMKLNGLQLLPVVVGGRVVGVVHLDELHAAVRSASDAEVAQPVSSLISQVYTCVSPAAVVEEALDAAALSKGGALVVAAEGGFYRGVVTHAELLSVATASVRPNRIAGMATPLGVYLTTGTVRAGAGDLGLFLTGVALALFYLVSDYAVAVGLNYLDSAVSVPGSLLYASREIMPFVLMLVMVRVSPLSAYHAAEHQTVAAIEAGEVLVPEVVSQMPRAHPRCGTNLVMILLIFSALEWIDRYVALLVSVLTWRFLGRYFQQYITTRPAAPKYIEKGVEAGRQLLAKYKEEVQNGCSAPLFVRLWNMGWIQVVAGYFFTVMLYAFLLRMWVF
jgi:CBS domain-containing protein